MTLLDRFHILLREYEAADIERQAPQRVERAGDLDCMVQSQILRFATLTRDAGEQCRTVTCLNAGTPRPPTMPMLRLMRRTIFIEGGAAETMFCAPAIYDFLLSGKWVQRVPRGRAAYLPGEYEFEGALILRDDTLQPGNMYFYQADERFFGHLGDLVVR